MKWNKAYVLTILLCGVGTLHSSSFLDSCKQLLVQAKAHITSVKTGISVPNILDIQRNPIPIEPIPPLVQPPTPNPTTFTLSFSLQDIFNKNKSLLTLLASLVALKGAHSIYKYYYASGAARKVTTDLQKIQKIQIQIGYNNGGKRYIELLPNPQNTFTVITWERGQQQTAVTTQNVAFNDIENLIAQSLQSIPTGLHNFSVEICVALKNRETIHWLTGINRLNISLQHTQNSLETGRTLWQHYFANKVYVIPYDSVTGLPNFNQATASYTITITKQHASHVPLMYLIATGATIATGQLGHPLCMIPCALVGAYISQKAPLAVPVPQFLSNMIFTRITASTEDEAKQKFINWAQTAYGPEQQQFKVTIDVQYKLNLPETVQRSAFSRSYTTHTYALTPFQFGLEANVVNQQEDATRIFDEHIQPKLQ